MFRALVDTGMHALVAATATLAIASKCDLGSDVPFELAEAKCAGGGIMRRLREKRQEDIIWIAPEKEFDEAPPTEKDAFHEAGSGLPYSQDVWDYHHTAGVGQVVRADNIDKLKNTEFDVLVIGGGITGAGTALEAATRGLSVALIDKGDFASCTSSKSTKLIHGGVRYLEQAFTQLDYGMISLVREALHERAHMINACNYMSKPLPILIPIKTWWEIPYMYAGVKLYELFAGDRRAVPRAKVLLGEDAAKAFPSLDPSELKGAIIYYDGQMNDARYTLTVALTANHYGAAIANYVKVDSLEHAAPSASAIAHAEAANKAAADANAAAGGEAAVAAVAPPLGRLVGANVTDVLSGESFPIRAKAVVNATGPFADTIRKMDDPNAEPLVVHSAGVHVTLPADVCPKTTGMLIPKTKDGRLLFCLPWEGGVVAGTTDAAAGLCDDPVPEEKDVGFILDALNEVLARPLTNDDVRSVWSGLRPLVRTPGAKSTAQLSRAHVVTASDSGLVSVMGGKFTTYRQMGEDAVEKTLETHKPLEIKARADSVTKDMLLQGAFQQKKKYDRMRTVLLTGFGMSVETADYLISNYGDRARVIAAIAARQAQDEQEDATRRFLTMGQVTRAIGSATETVLPYLNPLAWASWVWTSTSAPRMSRRQAAQLDRELADDIDSSVSPNAERRAKLTQAEKDRRREDRLEEKRMGVYHREPIRHDQPAKRGSKVYEGPAEVGRDALRWRRRIRRLSDAHPALEAEVVYAVRHEMAQTVTDVLARRIRMAFSDAHAAEDAIERTAELMAPRLGWTEERRSKEIAGARAYFQAMQLHPHPATAAAAASAVGVTPAPPTVEQA